MRNRQTFNVAADLASALGMNYAYGVEFVEVDPIALGIEKFEEISEKDSAELAQELRVDQKLYRGLHGTAILSRFSLENVRLQPFEHQPHDWYKEELEGVKPLEKGKRKAGELVFQEKVRREVRRGGRMMLTADIADARIPGGRMVVVATHLEDKTKPEVARTIAFVGRFKLDWIFVKPPSLTEPYDEEQPHRFAPHFGRTLKSLNDSMKDCISDHAPIMVDLPLAEPPLTKKREKRTIQTKN